MRSLEQMALQGSERSLRRLGLQSPRICIEFESLAQEAFVTLVRDCQSERAGTTGEASQSLGMEQQLGPHRFAGSGFAGEYPT
jgi:hypothetical protein